MIPYCPHHGRTLLPLLTAGWWWCAPFSHIVRVDPFDHVVDPYVKAA